MNSESGTGSRPPRTGKGRHADRHRPRLFRAGIAEAIAGGDLGPGDALPSIRAEDALGLPPAARLEWHTLRGLTGHVLWAHETETRGRETR